MLLLTLRLEFLLHLLLLAIDLRPTQEVHHRRYADAAYLSTRDVD